MKDGGQHNRWFEALREKAEKIADSGDRALAIHDIHDIEALVHELHVYHIELETQNRELRETQNLLEASRSKYYELFDLAPVGYATLTEEGTVREVNLTACDMLDADRIQLKDKPFIIHVAPESHADFYEHIGNVLKTGKRHSTTVTLQTKSGRRPRVRLETAPLLDKQHGLKHLLMTITDISELVKAYEEKTRMARQLEVSQHQLKIRNDVATVFLTSQEEDTLRLLLHIVIAELSAPMAFLVIGPKEQFTCTSVIVDPNGKEEAQDPAVSLVCRDLCRSWWASFSHRPEPMIADRSTGFLDSHVGLEYAVIVPVAYRDQLLGMLAAGRNDRAFTGEDLDTVRMIADSLAPLLHARIQRQREQAERQRLESERRQLETQLREAQKMEAIGRLAGGVAHDFNNNLQVILGRTDILFEMLDPRHPAYSHVEDIHRAGLRSADLTRQLLAFARRQLISPRAINLNDTVEGTLRMLRRLIGEDIELVWKGSPHLWFVKMDPSQVDQILANLCVNARDAIDGSGRIVIETANVSLPQDRAHPGLELAPGDYVMLSVSDTGCGMDRDTLGKIFEPFFTTKEIGKGTGLGLATVYGIVKQNDGEITVESEPGRGTRFSIYFPRCTEAPQDETPAKTPPIPRGAGETVLIVEDDPAILTMAGTMLEQLGYEVLAASHPFKALELALEHPGPIDLLVTDVIMPDLNGKILAQEVQRMRPETRILFMSGYSSETLLGRDLAAGSVSFLKKPFSRAELAQRVRSLLDQAGEAPPASTQQSLDELPNAPSEEEPGA